MKIKYIYIIAALLAIIATSVNVFQILRKKNVEILNLSLTLEELVKNNNKLETALDFSNNVSNLHFEHEYILYFPEDACSSCLESIVLVISKNVRIWDNMLLYFDSEKKKELIPYLKDSYNLDFDYEIGKPLYEKRLGDIFLFKCKNSLITNIIVLNQNNIADLDKYLSKKE